MVRTEVLSFWGQWGIFIVCAGQARPGWHPLHVMKDTYAWVCKKAAYTPMIYYRELVCAFCSTMTSPQLCVNYIHPTTLNSDLIYGAFWFQIPSSLIYSKQT